MTVVEYPPVAYLLSTTRTWVDLGIAAVSKQMNNYSFSGSQHISCENLWVSLDVCWVSMTMSQVMTG